MSEESVKYRNAMKAKAHRLADQKEGRVDASDYHIPGKPTSSEPQTWVNPKPGLVGSTKNPVNPREYKRGGLATGGKAKHHAGRRKRYSGGEAAQYAKANAQVGQDRDDPDVSPTVEAYNIDRKNKIGEQTGYGDKRGGRIKRQMGGPTMPATAPGMNVPVNRFNLSPVPNKMGAAIQGATGIKKGGKVEHSDEAADRKLIDKMVKPEARRERKSGGGNWIAGAIKHPGALHKELGVPEGKKIPEKKLKKAEHSDNPKEAKRARLAETLKGMHKKDGGSVSDGEIQGTRPTGGRLARKEGGRAKGKTNIAIIIGGHDRPPDQPPASMTQGVARPPMPPMQPPPPAMAPPMAPPMGGGMPPGAMPPPGMPPQMPPRQPMPMRADGGRLVKPGAYPIDAGGGGGKATLEKAKEYGQ